MTPEFILALASIAVYLFEQRDSALTPSAIWSVISAQLRRFDTTQCKLENGVWMPYYSINVYFLIFKVGVSDGGEALYLDYDRRRYKGANGLLEAFSTMLSQVAFSPRVDALPRQAAASSIALLAHLQAMQGLQEYATDLKLLALRRPSKPVMADRARKYLKVVEATNPTFLWGIDDARNNLHECYAVAQTLVQFHEELEKKQSQPPQG